MNGFESPFSTPHSPPRSPSPSPPGYEKALQLYFQRLGRVEEGAASVGEK